MTAKDFSQTIYGKSRRGRHGYHISSRPTEAPRDIPREYLRDGRIGLPEVAELQVLRHYVDLSTKNHHVEKDLFPLLLQAIRTKKKRSRLAKRRKRVTESTIVFGYSVPNQ